MAKKIDHGKSVGIINLAIAPERLKVFPGSTNSSPVEEKTPTVGFFENTKPRRLPLAARGAQEESVELVAFFLPRGWPLFHIMSDWA